MLENYRLSTGRPMELDIYLPKEKLAFEYQGEAHYMDIYALGNRWRQKQRDEEKRQICLENGITLIEVPYWWNWERSSLIGTIRRRRQNLLALYKNEEGDSIPNHPPKEIVYGKQKTITHG